MNQLRVVHVLQNWLNETQNWIFQQIRHLPDTVRNTIVCQREKNTDAYAMPDVRSYESDQSLHQLWIRFREKMGLGTHVDFFGRQIEDVEPAVVHSHFGPVGWEVQQVIPEDVKHVVTFYGYDMSRLPAEEPEWEERYDELFESVDRVLCEGGHMAKELIRLGCPAPNVAVHHLGIDPDLVPFRPCSYEKGDPLRVLIAGRFCEKKGIPYALRALGELDDAWDLEVTLIGEGEENETRRIQEALDTCDLHSTVRMPGHLSHKRYLSELYEHHLFLAPSITAEDGDAEGGIPVSILEAAASGTLVVSTRHCDIPEVIRDRKTGLLAEERSVDDLVDCLQWSLSNPKEWGGMIEKARERIETEYNAREQGKRLSDQYRKVVS